MHRLKILRNELNLTQEDLAKKIHISRSTISNIEANRVALTDRNIADISKAFNISEFWLRTGAGSMFIKNTFPEFLHEILKEEDSLMKDTIINLCRLDKKEFEIVAKMISALANK